VEAKAAIQQYDAQTRRTGTTMGSGLPNYNFISDKYTAIYVPLWFPKSQQLVLDGRRKDNPDEDPVTSMLNEDPDTLIQWLNGRNCQFCLQCTTCIFLILHAAIIGCGTVCGSLIFRPFENLIDMLPRFFGK
jgi:hypothetical protein